MLNSVPGVCAFGEMMSYTTHGKCTAAQARGVDGMSERLKDLTGSAHTNSICHYITNVDSVRKAKQKPILMQNWSVPEYLEHLHALHPRVSCCEACDAWHHSGATATGYKLFWAHVLFHEANSPGLDMLQTMEDTSTSVIVFRRSAVARYISGVHASMSGISHCGKGCDVTALRGLKVHIDTRRLLASVAASEKQHQAVDARLQRYPQLRVLKLTYAAFTESPDWCTVLQFLKMPCVKRLSSVLIKKSGNATPADRVSNAQEVRAALSRAGRSDLLQDFDSTSR